MGQMKDEMGEIHDTAERILRAVAVAVIDRNGTIRTEDQQALALKPLEPMLEAHMVMLRECMVRASLAGVDSVHRTLHAQPGIDPYMLDEAVEHAPKDGGDDGE